MNISIKLPSNLNSADRIIVTSMLCEAYNKAFYDVRYFTFIRIVEMLNDALKHSYLSSHNYTLKVSQIRSETISCFRPADSLSRLYIKGSYAVVGVLSNFRVSLEDPDNYVEDMSSITGIMEALSFNLKDRKTNIVGIPRWSKSLDKYKDNILNYLLPKGS